jgi:hypothetical protein
MKIQSLTVQHDPAEDRIVLLARSADAERILLLTKGGKGVRPFAEEGKRSDPIDSPCCRKVKAQADWGEGRQRTVHGGLLDNRLDDCPSWRQRAWRRGPQCRQNQQPSRLQTRQELQAGVDLRVPRQGCPAADLPTRCRRTWTTCSPNTHSWTLPDWKMSSTACQIGIR